MSSELLRRIRRCALLCPGDRVVCAVSGGADSMALLWALWTQRQSLGITVSAAHFNHRLRGAESERDEAFVRAFCREHRIPLQLGGGDAAAHAAAAGQSVEQAARTLRYQFLQSLSCDKIATAHTADDNAETVLLNLLRGTGLRGLCGIPEQRGRIIRPLLHTRREEIEAFLDENGIAHVEDSTNAGDDALRNRIRHRMLPLCRQENPAFVETVDEMVSTLRQEEAFLQEQTLRCLSACSRPGGYDVPYLRALPEVLRFRALRQLLRQYAVECVTRRHVEGLNALLFSASPSARMALPGGLTAAREYDRLCFRPAEPTGFAPVLVNRNGETALPELGLRILCAPAAEPINTPTAFTVTPKGAIYARVRRAGDEMTLSGGTKSLKKIMIDRKIPRFSRERLPVLADDEGVLAVYTVGANLSRTGVDGAVTIQVMPMEGENER